MKTKTMQMMMDAVDAMRLIVSAMDDALNQEIVDDEWDIKTVADSPSAKRERTALFVVGEE